MKHFALFEIYLSGPFTAVFCQEYCQNALTQRSLKAFGDDMNINICTLSDSFIGKRPNYNRVA